MVQVDSKTHERIDFLLSRSSSCWKELPELEAEIRDWDYWGRVVIIEWGIRESWLSHLDQYASLGDMTEKQFVRYKELQEVVAENQPIIDRLSQGVGLE